MNEFLRNFVKKTIFKMIDVVPEWQVREYALGWYAKGILTEEDLAEIEEKYNKPEEEPVVAENELTEEVAEEPVEENVETENTEESEAE